MQGDKKKSVIKKDLSFGDYKDCLLHGKPQMRKMNIFESHLHHIYSVQVNKVALSRDDDKRIILSDGIHTFAHYYFRILSGGSSVPLGTI